eukprot:TRINITY_DN1677_c0_g1_i1.p1 TRINITY_DN1677_c0_g1~~TRINITY_DN1677_c0_g1_i1.p1  ORF type:complete len:275 (-),score=91.71 TRINITY_DN1677_c0_g1_i1:29-853(-)
MEVESNDGQAFPKVLEHFNRLKADFDGPSPNLAKCKSLLSDLKILLTDCAVPFLLPTSQSVSPSDVQRMIIAREILEYATLLSVKEKDIPAFERNISQLKTYYFDAKSTLPPSSRQFQLLGLNLLRLLALKRLAEFHTELELFTVEQLGNVYIRHPISLEQHLMEGSYNKILAAKNDLPDSNGSYYMEILMETVRDQIASCSEKAYEHLSLNSARKLMSFSNEKELVEYAEKRGWVIQGGQIVFKNDEKVKLEIPNTEVIRQTLSYAKELERIV